MKILDNTDYRIQKISSCLISFLTMCFILYYAKFGIDFTDEGYYLNWISNPFIYEYSVTQFGFVYHPLYVLLDGNIYLLRVINIVITLMLSFALCKLFIETLIFKDLYLVDKKPDKSAIWIISLALSIFSLLEFSMSNLVTPSYNSLNYQAFILLVIGYLFLEKSKGVLASILIGIASTFIFLAKASSLIILPVLLLVIFLRKKFSFYLFFIAILSSLSSLLIAILYIDGNIFDFITRLVVEHERVLMTDSRYSFFALFKLASLNLSMIKKIYVFMVCTTAMIFLYISYISNVKKYIYNIIIWFTIIAVFLVLSIILYGDNIYLFLSRNKQLLLLWTVILFVVLQCYKVLSLKNIRDISPLLLLFLLVPYCMAFGTNGSYWYTMLSANIFWIFCAVLITQFLTYDNRVSLLLTMLCVSQVLIVIFINQGINNPYRQPYSLRQNSQPINVGNTGQLILTKEYAEYIENARRKSISSGLQKNDFILDLTGQSPGLIYAIGARSIGLAWLIGGYKGSDEGAIFILKRNSCDSISSSWLLVEQGNRSLSVKKVLASYGATLGDYQLMAQWKTASGAGGYNEQRIQKLYRPKSSASIKISCRKQRDTEKK